MATVILITYINNDSHSSSLLLRYFEVQLNLTYFEDIS